MRYTRNLEALLMGQKLNTYQLGLANEEYNWLKSEVSKFHQPTVSGAFCDCIEEYDLHRPLGGTTEYCTHCGLKAK